MREGDFSDEDELDSECPRINEFVDHHGLEVYKALTPFSFLEFGQIWDEIGVDFSSVWYKGRGPRSKTKAKDAFFIMLNVLHQPKKWDEVGLYFGMSGQVAEKTVWKTLTLVSPFLVAAFVREVNKDSFRRLKISECKNFPHVHHLTDASVVQVNRPAMSFAEAQHWFSGMYNFLFSFFVIIYFYFLILLFLQVNIIFTA